MRRFTALSLVMALVLLMAGPAQAAPTLSKTSTVDLEITRTSGPGAWTLTFTAKETKDGGDKGFFLWTENGSEYSWDYESGSLSFWDSPSGPFAFFNVVYEDLPGTTLDDVQKELAEGAGCALVSGVTPLEILVQDGGKEDPDVLLINVPCGPDLWSWVYLETGDLKVKIRD